MNLSIALTATAFGATCANHIEATSLLKDDNGKVCGAETIDLATGEKIKIGAKVVVNATGPFSDGIRRMDDPKCDDMIVPSAGVHITLSDRYSPSGMGLIVPETKDGRVLFLLPWEGSTIVGTTDSKTRVTSLPKPREEEIQFIIDEVSRYVQGEVKRSDVDAAWSGIRPLARDVSATDTKSISRDHVLVESESGLITIAGGKWTTYRKMSEDAVDLVVEKLKLPSSPVCKTTGLRLIGAHGWSLALPTVVERLGFANDISEHLSRNYGDKSVGVAELAIAEDLGARLVAGYPFIEAEVVYGCRHEYAITAIDVLARRMRLACLNSDAALKVLPRVIALMSSELGWNLQQRLRAFHDGRIYINTMNRRGSTKADQDVSRVGQRLRSIFSFSPLDDSQAEKLSNAFYESTVPMDIAKAKDLVAKQKGLNISPSTLGEFEEALRSIASSIDEGISLEEFLFAAAASFGRKE